LTRLISGAVIPLGGRATVRLRGALAVTELASLTCTVKLLVPVAVGVPVMAPVAEFRDKPAGRVPEERDQE
jgi:hypothetical protein